MYDVELMKEYKKLLEENIKLKLKVKGLEITSESLNEDILALEKELESIKEAFVDIEEDSYTLGKNISISVHPEHKEAYSVIAGLLTDASVVKAREKKYKEWFSPLIEEGEENGIQQSVVNS